MCRYFLEKLWRRKSGNNDSEIWSLNFEVWSPKSEVWSLKIPLAFRTLHLWVQRVFIIIDRNLTALFNQIKTNLNKC
jgi:hypothetical protein